MKNHNKILIAGLIGIFSLSACSSFTSSANAQSDSQSVEPAETADILRPYNGGETNPYSPEKMETLIEEVFGDSIYLEYGYLAFGSEFDGIWERMHFTDDEMTYFVSFLKAAIFNADTEGNAGSTNALLTALYSFLANIDTDHLLASLREYSQNVDLFNKIVAIAMSEYNESSVFAAVDYFDGIGDSKQKLNDLKDYYIQYAPDLDSIDDGGPYLLIKNEIFDFINSDSAYMTLRILSHFFKALTTNLTEKELFIFNTNFVESENAEDSIDEYLYGEDSDNLKNYLNHLGNALLDFDLPVEAFEGFLDAGYYISKIASAIENEKYNYVMSLKEYDSFYQLLVSAIDGIDPLGLKTAINLFGHLLSDLDNVELEMLDFIEPTSATDKLSVKEKVDYMISYYEERYNVYSNEEKQAIDRTFLSFGISYKRLVETLKERVEESDFVSVNNILEEVFDEQLGKRFSWSKEGYVSFRDEDSDKFDCLPPLREGTTVRFTDINGTVRIEHNDKKRDSGYCYTEYLNFASDLNFGDKTTFDTSKPGINKLKFSYDSNSYEIYYVVVAKDVDYMLHRSFDYEHICYELPEEPGTYDTFSYGIRDVDDGRIACDDYCLYFEKGSVFSANTTLVFDDYSYFVFDADANRFKILRVDSYDDLAVKINTIGVDFNQVGTYFSYNEINVNLSSGASYKLPFSIRCEVVEEINDNFFNHYDHDSHFDFNGPYYF